MAKEHIVNFIVCHHFFGFSAVSCRHRPSSLRPFCHSMATDCEHMTPDICGNKTFRWLEQLKVDAGLV